MTEDLVAVLRSVTRDDDPVERIGQAAEVLGQAVLGRGAVRVLVASTIAKPATARDRPAHRFGLISAPALAPWIDKCGPAGRADAERLVRGLAVVISAESLFTLTDLCGLAPDAAVASLADTARAMTAAAVAATPAG